MRKRLLLILSCVALVLLAGYVTLRLTDNFSVYIHFDDSGRVTERRLGFFPHSFGPTLRQADDSFLDKIRRWLGM